MNNHNKQRGLTIVELMVALLLSLLLMGGVLQIYLGTQTTYKVTEGLSRVQENTRFATDMLARDIRMAGYIPCGQPQNPINLVDSTQWWAQLFANPIMGYENGANPFPGVSPNPVAPGTDSIVILRGGSEVAAVSSYDQANNQIILQRDVGGSNWVEPGSIMVACDANQARLFQAGAIQAGDPTRVNIADGSEGPGNSSTNLAFAFDSTSQLSNYNAVAYYITASSSTDGFSLYRRYLNVNSSRQIGIETEELIEGVESMQLQYGLDTDGDEIADRYLLADSAQLAGNWQSVVSVKVGLLFASEDGMREGEEFDEKTYVVGDTNIAVEGAPSGPTHARDQRKRYVSSMTVSRRNI